MKNVIGRQYRILADHMKIYQFMLEIYEKDWRNGVPAPFLEYALSSYWMDKSYTHRNRIWEENGEIVAFCFTESPITDIYFSLKPGYEELAMEMVEYADAYMPKKDDKLQFVLFEGQGAIMKAAKKLGYEQVGGYDDKIYEFDKPLEFKLPSGYKFVAYKDLDTAKVIECCWKGFNHEIEEGPWDQNAESGYHLSQAPHATMQYGVAVENISGDYVCWAGMWWTPQNHLAYMEPLCTVPQYRKKGLAAAALSEMYHRMQPLGATHMTGGGNEFYEKIGFKNKIKWTFWKKTEGLN